MNTNKILLSGLLGGVAAFFIGFLVFGIGLAGILESNMGSATGVMRADSDLNMVPMILGHLGIGMLLSYIFGHWASISTFSTGLKSGAIVGFMVGFIVHMINLGSTYLYNLTGTIIEILGITVVWALVGGIVGLLLGRIGKK
ncbi:MAG: hypothetical protein AAFR66_22480 [Bacteroidota bacterium]